MKIFLIIIFSIIFVSCSNINKTIRVACIKKSSTLVSTTSFTNDILSLVNDNKTDIVFFDHIKQEELDALKGALPAYDFLSSISHDGAVQSGKTPINMAVNRKKFTIQTQIFLTLNNVKSPQDPHGGVLAIKVRDNKAGRTIFVVNSTISGSRANEHIYNIHKIIKSYTDELPVILAGDFGNNDENIQLLTGNWTNLVKLDGEEIKNEQNGNRKTNQCLFVNGFLSIDRIYSVRNFNSIQNSNYNVSFNKNYKDVRTHASPYPLENPLPSFNLRQIVFNDKLDIEVDNKSDISRVVYTTDESIPNFNSPVFINPITIDNTCRIKLRSINKNGEISPVVCRYFVKTDKEYMINRVTANPKWDQERYKSFDFLTDRQKGDDARNSDSWMEIQPQQSVSIVLDFNEQVKLNKTYISFSKLGNHSLPAIAITSRDTTGRITRLPIDTKMMGGYESVCGLEAWLVIDTVVDSKQIMLDIKAATGEKNTLYIDEIVLN
jgi:hypothetical protein